MNKVQNSLSMSHLRILYTSLIEPYLNYGSIIWASPGKNTTLEVLHKLQKGTVRIVTYANYRAYSKTIFHNLNILNVYDLCLTHILHFVYKFLNCLLPPRYQDYFTVMEHKYSHYTRGSKQNLYALTAVKTCRRNSLRIRAHKYSNKLPQSLKDSSSL